LYFSIVHPFVFAFGGKNQHIPLVIVGYFYHTVEIEKGNPPTLAQRDGKRRIVFVTKQQPETTTVMIYFKVGGTARTYPCSAYITKRKTGIYIVPDMAYSIFFSWLAIVYFRQYV
jgi:hypothetical protein